MSASTRIPAILSTLTVASSAVALTVSPSLRSQVLPSQILAILPPHLGRHALRLLAAIVLILNLKNVPTTWHIRVLRAIIHQLYLTPKPIARAQLFAPIVTHSWNSPLDCDYNFHKSNSTYFKDLDVSRAHYVGALIRTGLRRLNSGDTEGLSSVSQDLDTTTPKGKKKVPKGYIIALGAVACSFRKEIKPLARFEVWTRLLSWDDKWIYVVSHIVRPGVLRPKGYHLQPWKEHSTSWFSGKGSKRKVKADPTPEQLRSAVYATSIAKYVCKNGRKTVPPTVLLERSRLLPPGPRPVDMPEASGALSSGAATPASSSGLEGPESAGPALANALRRSAAANASKEGERDKEETEMSGLTWEEVESLRVRGLKYARMFDGLAGLHDEFGVDSQGGAEDVLGVYGDLIY